MKSKEVVQDIVESVNNPPPIVLPTNNRKFISTGSTLLDLAISGRVHPTGGIPSGTVVEIYGPNSVGKTAILCEIAADAQKRGGSVDFLDPEARLDTIYAENYGMHIKGYELCLEKLAKLKEEDKEEGDDDPIDPNQHYFRPKTVRRMFNIIKNWNPPEKDQVNVMVADSLAALSTQIELEGQDKMGMKRAKDFSEGFRVVANDISSKNKLLVCSNQIRDSGDGKVAPGGLAIGFYASLRIEMSKCFPSWKMEKEKTINGQKHKQMYGQWSHCVCVKSSIDNPRREADIPIIFNYGIDDIRANLIWVNASKGNKGFIVGEKEFGKNSIDAAIAYVENEGLEDVLKKEVIMVWNEIQDAFFIDRKPKKRG